MESAKPKDSKLRWRWRGGCNMKFAGGDSAFDGMASCRDEASGARCEEEQQQHFHQGEGLGVGSTRTSHPQTGERESQSAQARAGLNLPPGPPPHQLSIIPLFNT